MASAKHPLSDAYNSAMDFLADMPISKAIAGVIQNPTPQEIGAQVANMGKSISQNLQEATKDPVETALNYGPAGMGTIIGKGAKGWATAENKFSNMLDKMERAEISDVGARIDLSRLPDNIYSKENLGITLGDVLDHPKLYEQYPYLKNIPVMNADMMGEQAMSMKPRKPGDLGIITINKPVYKENSVLLHEIQHIIQDKEGFSAGGSPSMFKSKLQDSALATGNNPRGEDIDSKAFQMYKKLLGEIEARAVEHRMNIPQDQLKYSQPYASEKIPLKEWINAEDFLDK